MQQLSFQPFNCMHACMNIQYNVEDTELNNIIFLLYRICEQQQRQQYNKNKDIIFFSVVMHVGVKEETHAYGKK